MKYVDHAFSACFRCLHGRGIEWLLGALLVLTIFGCRRVQSPAPPVPHTVVLEVRSGAVGGNPVNVSPGRVSRFVRQESATPLSFDVPPDINERPSAYTKGGPIPTGKLFAIESIRYRGTSAGDSNGHGEFRVSVGGEVIVRSGETDDVTEGDWNGRIEVRSGREDTIQLEVSNSSSGRVEFIGVLEDDLTPIPRSSRQFTRWFMTSEGHQVLFGLLVALAIALFCLRERRQRLALAIVVLILSSFVLLSLMRWGIPAADSVKLDSRQKHQSYERATFSFDHGIRDDPGLDITRNDWDIQFGNGGDDFTVTMVVDDRSQIEDLGPRVWPAMSFSTATLKQPASDRAAAVEGHMYVAHVEDSDSDFHVFFRVDELVAGDTCTISWRIVDPTNQPAIGGIVMSLAILALFVGSFLVVFGAAARKIRGVIRLRRGLCPRCAYPLSDSETCPECGTEVTG